MSTIKILALALILIYVVSSVSFAATEYKSFVDEMVDAPRLLEEDADDEFLAEKQELNQIALEELISNGKIQEFAKKSLVLQNKLHELYGKTYEDYDLVHAYPKIFALYAEKHLAEDFPYKFSNYDENKIKQALLNENSRKLFFEDIQKFIKGSLPIELIFHLDRQFVHADKKFLGESSPNTLKDMKNLAQDYSLLGDSKTALEIEKKLLPKILKTFGEKSSEAAEIFELMAIDYKILGNYKKSRESILKALEINKKNFNVEKSSKLMSNIIELINLNKSVLGNEDSASLYRELDKTAKNISEEELYRLGYFRVKVFKDFHDDREIDRNLTEVKSKEIDAFDDLRQREDYRNFIKRFSEQSAIEHKLGLYADAMTNDLLWVSNCKIYFGNYHHETLRAICNLSDDYLSVNQFEDALDLAQMALNTSQKIYGDEHPCTVYAMHSVTNAYRKMGKYEDALKLDQQAEKLCKKIFVTDSKEESLEKLTVLEDIANDYEGLQDYSTAIKYSEELLSRYVSYNVNDSKSLAVRKNLAHLYNLLGDYEKTVALYNFLKQGDNYTLNKLPADGIIKCQTAAELADALDFLGINISANQCYRAAVLGYESLRFRNIGLTNEEKRQWFSGFIPTYKKAAMFLVTQGNNKEALRVSEYCKARTLSENYSDLLAIYKGGLNDEDIETLNAYHKNFSQYRDRFRKEFTAGSNRLKFNLRVSQMKLNVEYTSFRRELHKKYPNYKELLNTGIIFTEDIFSPNQIKKIIPINHCYMTFSILNDKILTLVVDENGVIKSYFISIDNKFFDKCNFYHELLAYSTEGNKYLWKLSDGNYTFTQTRKLPAKDAVVVKKDSAELKELIQSLSAELGEKLLMPLNDAVAGKQTWIISPDGELNNIPFETLKFNGKMAIESADICYVPSFSVLKLMQDMKVKNDFIPNRKELFAMGGAIYGKHDDANSRGSLNKFLKDLKENPTSYVDLTKIKWENLDHTIEELNKVSEIFPADSQEIVTGFNASEKNLKQRDKDRQLAQYKYILFATHGLFLPSKPEVSSIVLSQGLNYENYDGYVTVGELFAYNLNSDLVYLSACESGLGDYQSGEGIIGLPYALTVAGNKDTVMSLWKIDDKIAPEFSSKFFQKLKDGQTEVQALNDTKREFLSSPNSQLNNPAVWSAFLLYGI